MPWDFVSRALRSDSRLARTARHPVTLLLCALVLFAGAGALIDSLRGPEGDATHGCFSPADDRMSSLREEITADRGNPPLLEEWRARRAYEHVWRHAAPLLGAGGTASPRMRFVGYHQAKPNPRAAMWVGPDEAGCRTIFIAPGQRRALGKVHGNIKSRDAALTRTLHETAHYFQSDAVLSDLFLREVGACAWARIHGPGLLHTRKASRRVVFNSWRDREQFGENYGRDPQSLGWPGLTYRVGTAGRSRAGHSGPPPAELDRRVTACGGGSRCPSRSLERCGRPPGT